MIYVYDGGSTSSNSSWCGRRRETMPAHSPAFCKATWLLQRGMLKYSPAWHRSALTRRTVRYTGFNNTVECYRRRHYTGALVNYQSSDINKSLRRCDVTAAIITLQWLRFIIHLPVYVSRTSFAIPRYRGIFSTGALLGAQVSGIVQSIFKTMSRFSKCILFFNKYSAFVMFLQLENCN